MEEDSKLYFSKLADIKKIYHNGVIDEIIKSHPVAISPYFIDWIGLDVFTPIESNVWSDIRYLGLPFYPQFPVGKYFIDFADPVLKIGIEVDGRAWHKDLNRDAVRQKQIEDLGWRIFRIKGYKTYKSRDGFIPEDFDSNDEELYENRLKDFMENSSEGFLIDIKKKYYPQTTMICYTQS